MLVGKENVNWRKRKMPGRGRREEWPKWKHHQENTMIAQVNEWRVINFFIFNFSSLDPRSLPIVDWWWLFCLHDSDDSHTARVNNKKKRAPKTLISHKKITKEEDEKILSDSFLASSVRDDLRLEIIARRHFDEFTAIECTHTVQLDRTSSPFDICHGYLMNGLGVSLTTNIKFESIAVVAVGGRWAKTFHSNWWPSCRRFIKKTRARAKSELAWRWRKQTSKRR